MCRSAGVANIGNSVGIASTVVTRAVGVQQGTHNFPRSISSQNFLLGATAAISVGRIVIVIVISTIFRLG